MRFWFLLLALLVAAPATADDLHLIELDEFSMESGKLVNYQDGYLGFQDPHNTSGEYWDTYTAANFNLDLLKYEKYGLYWNNTVAGASTNDQYRMTKWHWEAGVAFTDRLQVFWQHESEHVLDAERAAHFPLFNFYGARITFYKRGN